jgi:hypothetical protein
MSGYVDLNETLIRYTWACIQNGIFSSVGSIAREIATLNVKNIHYHPYTKIFYWNWSRIGPRFHVLRFWRACYSFLLILCRSRPENGRILSGFRASTVSVCHKRVNLTGLNLGNFGPILHTLQIIFYHCPTISKSEKYKWTFPILNIQNRKYFSM